MPDSKERFSPRFIVFDDQYRVAIVQSTRLIANSEAQEELRNALPRVVWERANAIYSIDFKCWVKWRATQRMDHLTRNVLNAFVERAEATIPTAVWKNLDPSFVWCGAFVNEDTGFHCGYRPVEQSDEEDT